METKETCTKCGRTRLMKYMAQRKNYSGKRVWRCTAHSVCASIARRNREKKERNS